MNKREARIEALQLVIQLIDKGDFWGRVIFPLAGADNENIAVAVGDIRNQLYRKWKKALRAEGYRPAGEVPPNWPVL